MFDLQIKSADYYCSIVWKYRPLSSFLKCLLLISFFLLPQEIKAEDNFVEGEYLMKYHEGLSPVQKHIISSEIGLLQIKDFGQSKSSLVEEYHTKQLDNETIKELLAAGIIEFFEPNFIVHAVSSPNDPHYPQQWGHKNTVQTGGTAGIDIDAELAWGLTTGSEDLVIGVVDSGVLSSHPDLAPNMWTNPFETSNGLDSDGNGIVDDIHGFNSISNSGNATDQNGHGTHCAGVIAGRGNNGTGITGVSWKSKIMSLKFLNAQGSGTLADAIEAIEYAITMKQRGVNIRILNNSWGGASYSYALENVIKSANDNNILFIVAAGNSAADNDNSNFYPANYNVDNVISVAALDHNGNLASFSNYGRNRVHVAAPGVGIYSTHLNNNYANLSGTSMSAPYVSGIAALILSREPNLSAAQLKQRIISSAEPFASLNGLVRSGGMANALRALSASSIPLPPMPTEASYTKRQMNFEYDAILGDRISQADDAYIERSLPFTFKFYDKEYSRIAISTNGRIIPLGNGVNPPASPDFAPTLYPGISPLHHDYLASPNSADGGVWVKEEESKVTITWVVIPYLYAQNSTLEREIRFQAILRPEGNIEFHYLKTSVGNNQLDFGAKASVSILPTVDSSGDPFILSHLTPQAVLLGNTKSIKLSLGRNAEFADIDGDGISDIIVWRPSNGYWYILTSSSNFNFDQHLTYQHGLPGDVPLIGNFDGDNQADMAVWRPSDGVWYLRNSSTQFSEVIAIQWGLHGDIPLVGDFDGDGVSDLTVYRPQTGMFYSLLSSNGYNRNNALHGDASSFKEISLGGIGHDPVIADFTGNGIDEYASIWQLVRFWSVKNANNELLFSLPWGIPGDTPLACDRDGDSRADRFVVRTSPDNHQDWFGVMATGEVELNRFGSRGDIPGCKHNIDSDGKPELMLFRPPTGEWIIKESSNGSIKKIQFGLPGDVPMLK